MYGVVRRYSGASELSDAIAQNSLEVQELISTVPGFVAYYAVRSNEGLATITICQDSTGTQESTRRAAEWVRQRGLTGGSGAPPEVTEGEVFINFEQ